ncbi:unnamed protein product [Clonostachys byssicola]|uniref:DUF7732 domain-containing protein n=1 Tax=Clonostachys byssicola TaxID=160290 RepID=A0A9N9XYU0_9HYPO|nr:unnamed protein product [Clonostachys byssicola]
MRSHLTFVTFIAFLFGLTAALAIDESRLHKDDLELLSSELQDRDSDATHELWKRKGGGGGGRGGGGGGSKGGSSSSSKGSSSSASRTNKAYYPGAQGGNTGGYSPGGSGPQPRFVSNTYYGGGAKAPYPAGGSPSGKSMTSSRSPSPLAYYPGYWPPYPIFIYPYGYHHSYRNKTSNQNETREIECACPQYSSCMCDDIEDTKFWDELIGDGDYKKLNKSLVTVAQVNGKTKIVLNGTVPNGTTTDCKDSKDCEAYYSDAASLLAHSLGLWPVAFTVFASVFFL